MMSVLRIVAVHFFFIFNFVFLPAVHAQETSPVEIEAIDFANSLLERELYSMAISEYQKFIGEYPQSTSLDEAYFAIAEAYFLSQQYPQAVEAINTVKQKFPNSPRQAQAVLRLGQLYVQEGKFDQAWQELTSIDPVNLLQGESLQSYYYYLGKAALGKNDSTFAFAQFEKATQVAEAKNYLSYSLEQMAVIHAQGGNLTEASAAFKRALESTEDTTYKAALLHKLGETLFRSGQYAESIDYFRQILDQFPNSESSIQALTNLLLASLNMKKFENVLADYQQFSGVLKDDLPYFEAHFAAARAMVELRKYDEALALLERIVHFAQITNDDLCRAGLVKADIQIKNRQYDQGLALLDGDLAACASSSEQAAFLKAQANFGLGQYDKAFEAYRAIKDNRPDSPYASAAWLGMAHARQEAGGGKEAADLFLAYVDAASDPALKSEALYFAALALSGSDLPSEAILAAQRYLNEFPQGNDYENTLLLLGELYARSGQFDTAVNLLQGHLATGISVKRADKVRFLLGYNLQLAGKLDEALAIYATIVADTHDSQFYLAGLKNSAIIYLGRQEEEKAAEYFDRRMMVAAQYRLDLETYLWVCDHYLKMGKFQDALRIAEQALAHYPDQQPQSIAYFKAEAYRGLKDYDNAQKYYDAVLAAGEKNTYTSGALIGKGLSFLAANKLADAKVQLEKAIEDYPEDYTVTMRARFEIATIAQHQNKLEEALNFYLMVGSMYDDDMYCPLALMSAGEILEKLARKEEALKVYEDIELKYPASEAATRAKQKIATLK